jgi:hypothetical protein
MVVYVRPSNEALLRARVPGAQDHHGCLSNLFIVGALPARRTVLPAPYPTFLTLLVPQTRGSAQSNLLLPDDTFTYSNTYGCSAKVGCVK